MSVIIEPDKAAIAEDLRDLARAWPSGRHDRGVYQWDYSADERTYSGWPEGAALQVRIRRDPGAPLWTARAYTVGHLRDVIDESILVATEHGASPVGVAIKLREAIREDGGIRAVTAARLRELLAMVEESGR